MGNESSTASSKPTDIIPVIMKPNIIEMINVKVLSSAKKDRFNVHDIVENVARMKRHRLISRNIRVRSRRYPDTTVPNIPDNTIIRPMVELDVDAPELSMICDKSVAMA